MTEHVAIVWGRKDICMCDWDGWNDYLSSVYNHKPQTHTVTLANSFFPNLFPSFALSILATLDQDPVTDPPKRDWLQERREFCLPSFLRLSVF